MTSILYLVSSHRAIERGFTETGHWTLIDLKRYISHRAIERGFTETPGPTESSMDLPTRTAPSSAASLRPHRSRLSERVGLVI